MTLAPDDTDPGAAAQGSAPDPPDDDGARRDLTVAELAVVRAHLTGTDPTPAGRALAALRRGSHATAPLDEIAQGLGLSPFERATLLLACGPELVGAVGRELAERFGSPRATFGTALELLPGAHWDAVTHRGPLRRWHLVRLADPDSVVAGPLVPDERVVHHLVGLDVLDERLELASSPLEAPVHLTATPARVVADVVSRRRAGPVLLRGPQPRSARALAAAACLAAGVRPRLLGADVFADAPVPATVRRLVRESVLGRVGWVLDVDDLPVATARVLGPLLTGTTAPVLLVSSNRPDGVAEALGTSVVEVPRLGPGERRDLLTDALGRARVGVAPAEVDRAAGAFDLALPDLGPVAEETARVGLWEACRRRPRAGVGTLARVRTTRAGWDELVLPERQLDQLRALAATVRHRARVLDDWGLGARSGRGRGTAALFAGGSGTGKTFAAEVIAHDLDLDLVHVDLSQVVDKYLGETEKRLARLFDAAEDGGMVLLFDEADALFGKRSEVKDSHDRYANVEVGYLLQRLEAFGGLAVLTTNARSALDPAFTRRLAVVVDFPSPDRASRERMWDLSLPAALPRADVSLARLADADLTGGAIAAAALQAAYLAAADGGVVTMDHLGQAVRWELAKTGRVASPVR
ncbi:ATP-binding protein [Isoptericola sp. 178]|uniref:ATP-binding protein n=1 Tax=Isoptericola sp. 178 TaxID=3064651 RepID=UPI00271326D4|nr:AAA family ATPase [Isoptericola sp. 178]MDO8144911.1 AAA family ATPase [Isoptericola sp. 178]